MEQKYHTSYPTDSVRAATNRRLFSFKDIPNDKERYSTEPVWIGAILEPLQDIINHPDRDTIMAIFFKDYK